MNKKKAIQWLFSDHTGISSKTMCAALLGVEYEDNDVPKDTADFKRCYDFALECELSLHDLIIILKTYPYWEPIIRNWGLLTGDLAVEHDVSDRLDSFRDEIIELKGYMRTGNGHWVKNN